jgi:addiction module HigA family antidote
MSIPRKHEQKGVPIHPGEFLREDFLLPLGLSANALALALRVPVTRISEIARERRGITADTALRLARYFGTTPDFWMKMQMSYDLALASREVTARIEVEIFPRATRRGTDGRLLEGKGADCTDQDGIEPACNNQEASPERPCPRRRTRTTTARLA